MDALTSARARLCEPQHVGWSLRPEPGQRVSPAWLLRVTDPRSGRVAAPPRCVSICPNRRRLRESLVLLVLVIGGGSRGRGREGGQGRFGCGSAALCFTAGFHSASRWEAQTRGT